MMAGLLYDSGAWWVMSARGDNADDVIRRLRRMVPRYRRDRLMAVPWTEQDEADYQQAKSRGGFLVIKDPEVHVRSRSGAHRMG